MQLTEAIDALLLATKANGRSPATVAAYDEKLNYLVDTLGDVDIETITVHDLRRYVAAQLARTENYDADNPEPGTLSPFTVAGRVRALKRLFNFLVEEGELEKNPAQRIHTPDPPRKAPKGISHKNQERLLKSTSENSVHDVRDRAIMLFLADTGCRLGGLCGLRLDDVEIEAQRATLTEKGEETRVVHFVDLTAAALRDWLAVRPDANTNALFLSMSRWGKPKGPITGTAVERMLTRRAERLGIEGKVNPHSFRHAFARDFLMSGGDLGTLSDIMGHSSVLVTKEFYAVFTSEQLRQKHDKHSPVNRLSEVLEEDDDDAI
jgi:site-specific recombinase XerD